MVELKKNDIVLLTNAKKGESPQGKWMLIPVKAKKGYDQLTLVVENIDEAYAFTGKAKVKEIISIKKSAKKYNDKWYDTYQATCILERLSEADAYAEGFGDFDEVNDTELPFN